MNPTPDANTPATHTPAAPRAKKPKGRASNPRLRNAHGAQLDRAVQGVQALRALKTKEADDLADEMVAKMDEVGKEAAAAHAFLTNKVDLRKEVGLTGEALKTSVDGVYGLTASEPSLAARLPVRADYAALDKGSLARKMAQALSGGGKRGALLAELLLASADAAQSATQKLEAFVDSDAPVRNAHAAVTELHMMNLQAVALIRRSAKAGSPAWNLIKPKRKVKAKPEATPASPGAAPAHATPATAPAPAAATQAPARA